MFEGTRQKNLGIKLSYAHARHWKQGLCSFAAQIFVLVGGHARLTLMRFYSQNAETNATVRGNSRFATDMVIIYRSLLPISLLTFVFFFSAMREYQPLGTVFRWPWKSNVCCGMTVECFFIYLS